MCNVHVSVLSIQVIHKVTGEIMVLKELFKFDMEAQNNFLKEVKSTLQFLKEFSFEIIGK